jgi:hypothetical protein
MGNPSNFFSDKQEMAWILFNILHFERIVLEWQQKPFPHIWLEPKYNKNQNVSKVSEKCSVLEGRDAARIFCLISKELVMNRVQSLDVGWIVLEWQHKTPSCFWLEPKFQKNQNCWKVAEKCVILDIMGETLQPPKNSFWIKQAVEATFNFMQAKLNCSLSQYGIQDSQGLLEHARMYV